MSEETRDNTPAKGEKKPEQQPLNADDLDVQELDDKLLEAAAGGTEDEVCWDMTCGTNTAAM